MAVFNLAKMGLLRRLNGGTYIENIIIDEN